MMSPALFLIHPHIREHPDSLRMFSGLTKAPGTKVFAQEELLHYLEMILNLEMAFCRRFRSSPNCSPPVFRVYEGKNRGHRNSGRRQGDAA